MGEAENKQKESLESASISTLIVSISSSALVCMGLEPSMKDKKNLKMAQFNIDLLESLQEKTKNNLTESESQLLSHCLQDLKMNFIKVKSSSA